MRRAVVSTFFFALAGLIVSVNWRGRSIAFSGDEPHYMMVVHSLLEDHDLELGPDYQRVAHGGFEAGIRFRGVMLDHHTVLVDKTSGQSKLWQEVFDWRVRECHAVGCEGWRRLTDDFPPGSSRSEVSAHPLGFPLFLAFILAPFRLTSAWIEPGVNTVVAALAWLGALLVYLCGRRAGFTWWESLLGTALLGLASPWLAYSRSFFVELPAGFLLLLALYGLLSDRPVLTGIAAGIAFALKPPFLLFGAAWVLERLWARDFRRALKVAVPLGAIGLAVGITNRVVAQRWVITGTAPWKGAKGLSGLHATLFDGAHGLLPFTPWVALVLVTWVAALIPRASPSPLARQIALPATLYLALLSANAYLGETCYGPRYWVAVLPMLALLAVEALRLSSQRRGALVGLLLLGTLGAYVAVIGAFNYPVLWDRAPVAMP